MAFMNPTSEFIKDLNKNPNDLAAKQAWADYALEQNDIHLHLGLIWAIEFNKWPYYSPKEHIYIWWSLNSYPHEGYYEADYNLEQRQDNPTCLPNCLTNAYDYRTTVASLEEAYRFIGRNIETLSKNLGKAVCYKQLGFF